ncbi:MAG: DUF3160 domain-containing protein [Lachnospiraceae bacterium]|nr:DUF3160 domain-containing protein [Lachnospiraceae bacterium]
MKRRILAALLCVTMVLPAFSCGKEAETDLPKHEREEKPDEPDAPDPGEPEILDGPGSEPPEPVSVKSGLRPSVMGDEETIYYDTALVPEVEPYTVAADFSNVFYNDIHDYMFNKNNESYNKKNDAVIEGLIKNNFAVDASNYDSEFWEIYESNRYIQFPNFVTVDSMMHTYHLYFGHLMRCTEREYLSDTLKTLSRDMLERTKKQYDELKGTDWEAAALRNLEFFYIGTALLDPSVSMPVNDAVFKSIAEQELDRIEAAASVEICGLTKGYEDYSQYKLRGYYENDETLQSYFRAMMWYGRIPFATDDEDMVKSAILMSVAVAENSADWEEIYAVTSFFAGASDDPGYIEIAAVLNDIYGDIPGTETLTADDEKLATVMSTLETMAPPAINSIPVEDGDDPVIKSFRFMGQRFTIDAAIMQRLVYDAVKENAEGDRRMLPDTLDAAAALGSERAYELLEEQGDTEYERYKENMMLAKTHFDNDDPVLWNASLYAGWMNTLRPLLVPKGEGYPSFMTNEKWTDKTLETFAGSYAELKHDTILYSKQVMAEMGGPEELDGIDERGYVEPEPVVYSRLINLTANTIKGLDSFGMLSEECRTELERLQEMAEKLLVISEKELKNELPDDEEYEFIKDYGGNIEHFWIEANKDINDQGLGYGYQAPAAVVADIATDPNGAILEVGTGMAEAVYVVFPIDGVLHIGRGSVFSFYQFVSGERLTDSEWRNRLSGGYLDEDTWEWVENDNTPERVYWTESYRVNLK